MIWLVAEVPGAGVGAPDGNTASDPDPASPASAPSSAPGHECQSAHQRLPPTPVLTAWGALLEFSLTICFAH